jgi:hypothetical protein
VYVPVIDPTTVTTQDSGVETASGARARRPGGVHDGPPEAPPRPEERDDAPWDAEAGEVPTGAGADQHV